MSDSQLTIHLIGNQPFTDLDSAIIAAQVRSRLTGKKVLIEQVTVPVPKQRLLTKVVSAAGGLPIRLSDDIRAGA